MNLSDIQRIATQTDFDNDNLFNRKGNRIKEYEKLDDVQVVDSAFPIQWADAVRKKFGVRNIGNWGWAYGTENFRHGTPVPCCPRSLAYFESMLGTDSELLIHEFYQTEDDEPIKENS